MFEKEMIKMRDEEKIASLRKAAMQLPLSPGVYIMKNAANEIIYIGKAKALKNRVSQYFAKTHHHLPKVEKMVENVDHFNYVIVDSEFEALILEASLIKQHKPKYNILLKDDKGYSFIRYTANEPFPRITAVFQKEDDGAIYLGPYNSSFAVREAVEEANKVFRLATCTRVFPRDIGRERPCLNAHIGLCRAPCARKITQENYRADAENAFRFLKNGGGEAVKSLTRQMNEAAESLQFEKAAACRDAIRALEKLTQKQKVVAAVAEDEDVIALAQTEGMACFQVLSVREHRLCDREEHVLSAVDEESIPAFFEEFLISFYSMKPYVPRVVLLDREPDNTDLLAAFLSQKAGRKVELRVPQKGEGKQLLDMAMENAAVKLQNLAERTDRRSKALEELADLLGLSFPPRVIESYDISHTAGSQMVAAMVVFRDGRPDKSAMRRFKVKTLQNQDDPAALAEVVERSLRRRLDGDSAFGSLPDLILLDGGVTQVNAVAAVLRNLNVSIPLFGMVKDDNHRTRAVTDAGREIGITSARAVFSLLSELQDEVHRAAIGYHRNLRGKAAVSMLLTDLPGIGKTRATELLKKFRTASALREASVDELAAVRGMNRTAAQTVFDAFHTGD